VLNPKKRIQKFIIIVKAILLIDKITEVDPFVMPVSNIVVSALK
jgi:hypothetical protein